MKVKPANEGKCREYEKKGVGNAKEGAGNAKGVDEWERRCMRGSRKTKKYSSREPTTPKTKTMKRNETKHNANVVERVV